MCRTPPGGRRYRRRQHRREGHASEGRPSPHADPVWLHPGRGLKVQAGRNGRAVPDASLARSDAFAGHGEWSDPDAVLMAVEVTSWNSDTDRRHRQEKPRVYAETGIPVHLLVDRAESEVAVHSEPGGQRYECVRTVSYGRDAHLPDPVGITLQTEVLKDWVR
ncbi:Uma2 family endonuclease [Streptomyces erythrochromogenes]|uniref:Uma2 family endonuclease n=1 Tax=Streptomyces erythrochromogenes TaxID=285574 RepID=UPI0036FE2552